MTDKITVAEIEYPIKLVGMDAVLEKLDKLEQSMNRADRGTQKHAKSVDLFLRKSRLGLLAIAGISGGILTKLGASVGRLSGIFSVVNAVITALAGAIVIGFLPEITRLNNYIAKNVIPNIIEWGVELQNADNKLKFLAESMSGMAGKAVGLTVKFFYNTGEKFWNWLTSGDGKLQAKDIGLRLSGLAEEAKDLGRSMWRGFKEGFDSDKLVPKSMGGEGSWSGLGGVAGGAALVGLMMKRRFGAAGKASRAARGGGLLGRLLGRGGGKRGGGGLGMGLFRGLGIAAGAGSAYNLMTGEGDGLDALFAGWGAYDAYRLLGGGKGGAAKGLMRGGGKLLPGIGGLLGLFSEGKNVSKGKGLFGGSYLESALSYGGMGAALGSVIPGVGTLIGGVAGAGIGMGGKATRDNWPRIEKGFKKIWRGGHKTFDSFTEQTTKFLVKPLMSFGDQADETWTKARKIMGGSWDKLKDAVGEAAAGFWDGVSGAADTFWAGATAAGQWVWDKVSSGADWLRSQAVSGGSFLWNNLSDGGNWVWDKLSDGGNAVWNSVTDGADYVYNKWRSIFASGDSSNGSSSSGGGSGGGTTSSGAPPGTTAYQPNTGSKKDSGHGGSTTNGKPSSGNPGSPNYGEAWYNPSPQGDRKNYDRAVADMNAKGHFYHQPEPGADYDLLFYKYESGGPNKNNSAWVKKNRWKWIRYPDMYGPGKDGWGAETTDGGLRSSHGYSDKSHMDIADRSLPRYKSGGIFSTPTAGIIGEMGPEAVVPLAKYNQMLGGGGGRGQAPQINVTNNTNNVFNINVSNGSDFMDTLRDPYYKVFTMGSGGWS